MAIILKPENVARLVFFVRGEKVLLDADLAMLYGVEARALNQAVARNRKRFPADFMFQLTKKEFDNMRSQFVTTSRRALVNSSQAVMSSRKHRGRAYRPYAFNRARRRHALERTAQLARGRGQHRHHADIRSTAPDHGYKPRPCPQNRSTRREIR